MSICRLEEDATEGESDWLSPICGRSCCPILFFLVNGVMDVWVHMEGTNQRWKLWRSDTSCCSFPAVCCWARPAIMVRTWFHQRDMTMSSFVLEMWFGCLFVVGFCLDGDRSHMTWNKTSPLSASSCRSTSAAPLLLSSLLSVEIWTFSGFKHGFCSASYE